MGAQAPVYVLLVEDDVEIRELRSVLEGRGAVVHTAQNVEQAFAQLAHEPVEVVIAGLHPGPEGVLSLLQRMDSSGLAPPVVVVGGKGGLGAALVALRAGAYDLLTLPTDSELLWAAVHRAREHHRLRREVHRLRQSTHGGSPLEGVNGKSPAELLPLAELERRYILRVLDAVGGNKALAARVLQLDRTTLYRKLERYGLGARGAPR